MKKILLILLVLSIAASPIYAALGTINLVYSNGQIVEDNGTTCFDFDIQVWLSEGEEILSSGMVYVEYPMSIFGELVVSNNNVLISKIGILDGVVPNIDVQYFDIITNDTYTNCYAITFENSDFIEKIKYSEVSIDPLEPSDLLHVRMIVENSGVGSVLFPSYIPGTDEIYYNYENEIFEGGLNIIEAIEEINIEGASPAIVGSVDFKKLDVKWKKGKIEIKWSTINEIDIEGYIIKRSSNDEMAVEIASYISNPSLEANNTNGNKKNNRNNRYYYYDSDVLNGIEYTYTIEAIDIEGNVLECDSKEVKVTSHVKKCHPNPFNPSFIVPLELLSNQEINIKLYDMSGRVVRNVAYGSYSAGFYEMRVDCGDLSSGVYILNSIIEGELSSQKMLLVK